MTGDHVRHSSMLLAAGERRPSSKAGPTDLEEGFRRGEELATERLMKQSVPAVTALVRRLLAWRGEVDDVVHDVFVAALMSRKRFRGDATFETWITSIAINRCRAHNRRRWVRQKLITTWREQQPPRLEPAASAQAVIDEQAEQVRRIVAELPHTYREVVVLFYLQQLPAAEVATILGLKTNAVEKRLSRARARLAKSLPDMTD